MHPNDYQARAGTTAQYAHADYPFLALAEEVGEVMGKLAKYSRKHDAHLATAVSVAYHEKDSQLHKDLVSELGDVLWQLQQCCSELGVPLNDLMHANLQKLADRKARNVIVGEGDIR